MKFILAVLLGSIATAELWGSPNPTGSADRSIAEAKRALNLVVVHVDRVQLANGDELLTVTGRIMNLSQEPQRVPPIKAELRNSSGQLMYSWTIQSPTPELPAKASTNFRNEEVIAPGGDELTLTFIGSRN